MRQFDGYAKFFVFHRLYQINVARYSMQRQNYFSRIRLPNDAKNGDFYSIFKILFPFSNRLGGGLLANYACSNVEGGWAYNVSALQAIFQEPLTI